MASKFHDFRAGNDPALDFGDFMEISRSFVSAYAKLMQAGLPQDSIAVAMLGATLNVYEMFGMRAQLPDLLRELAEDIESNTLAN